MIYFVEAVGVGNIKIGFTDGQDATGRIDQLQTGSPVPLRLLKTIPGSLEDEKALHRRFASHRVTGEWFKPSADLLKLADPSRLQECDGLLVAEKSISIRVLSVGRRNISKSLIEQLPFGYCINWCLLAEDLLDSKYSHDEHGDVTYESFMNFDPSTRNDFLAHRFKCDVWGWVRYYSSGQPQIDRYIIFEKDGRLFTQTGYRSLAYGSRTEGRDDIIKTMASRLHRDLQWSIPGWREEDQLFIGV